MLWESFASALLGLTAAYFLVRRYPGRFRDRRLALATGPSAAFFGGLLTHAVLGTGHALVVLAVGALFSAVLLSLLVRTESPSRRHRAGHRAGHAAGLSG
jgi:hypothetical protein